MRTAHTPRLESRGEGRLEPGLTFAWRRASRSNRFGNGRQVLSGASGRLDQEMTLLRGLGSLCLRRFVQDRDDYHSRRFEPGPQLGGVGDIGKQNVVLTAVDLNLQIGFARNLAVGVANQSQILLQVELARGTLEARGAWRVDQNRRRIAGGQRSLPPDAAGSERLVAARGKVGATGCEKTG